MMSFHIYTTFYFSAHYLHLADGGGGGGGDGGGVSFPRSDVHFRAHLHRHESHSLPRLFSFPRFALPMILFSFRRS